ncbi:carbohydrate ABC transporter permease [Naasia lichenicola]|uniref:Carbohydrate ABC transporter permease n=1 Tax=Naasia lichenicola TaxID=2565933 RepID=A0A4S4FSB1_9MICO|nr:carbohydrate ABC transporter permease [Naasia lichenicola]THG33284.1 carbohydrate ABC transporter permease [Naasia lichenicola]
MAVRARRGVFRLSRAAVTVAVIAIVVIAFLLPYLWILSSSFKDQSTIFSDVSPLSWKTFWPTEGSLANYFSTIETKNVGRAMLNSVIIAVLQVIFTLVLGSLAAFGLTRIKFRGSGLLFGLILVTFLVPMEALVVPLYAWMGDLHLRNSLVAVFLPWIASPFALFMLRQAFEEIPTELDEAAYIDGAGPFRVFWSVILPSVRSTVVGCGLVVFLFSWNSFLWPLVVNSSSAQQVIQVAVAQSAAPGQLPNWGETFAGAMIATLPLILIFLFAQRHIVQGLASSGLK